MGREEAHQPAKISERQPAHVPQQTRQAEREPVRRQDAPQQQRAEEPWIPTDEELAEIEARERAEAGGQSEQRQAAPAGRRSRGQMSLD